jgi:hypothetical protein
MITRIEFVEEVDNTPSVKDGYDGDYSQGTVWTNWKIYRLVGSSAEPDQYIRVGQVYNSYGNEEGSTGPELVTKGTKMVTVWQ